MSEGLKSFAHDLVTWRLSPIIMGLGPILLASLLGKVKNLKISPGGEGFRPVVGIIKALARKADRVIVAGLCNRSQTVVSRLQQANRPTIEAALSTAQIKSDTQTALVFSRRARCCPARESLAQNAGSLSISPAWKRPTIQWPEGQLSRHKGTIINADNVTQQMQAMNWGARNIQVLITDQHDILLNTFRHLNPTADQCAPGLAGIKRYIEITTSRKPIHLESAC